ncbi:MAG: hypothetical protein Q9167_006202 [Letrouitia subvulpina]
MSFDISRGFHTQPNRRVSVLNYFLLSELVGLSNVHVRPSWLAPVARMTARINYYANPFTSPIAVRSIVEAVRNPIRRQAIHIAKTD